METVPVSLLQEDSDPEVSTFDLRAPVVEQFKAVLLHFLNQLFQWNPTPPAVSGLDPPLPLLPPTHQKCDAALVRPLGVNTPS